LNNLLEDATVSDTEKEAMRLLLTTQTGKLAEFTTQDDAFNMVEATEKAAEADKKKWEDRAKTEALRKRDDTEWQNKVADVVTSIATI